MLNIYQTFFVFMLMSFNIVELDFNMYYSYLSEKLRSYKPDLKFLIRMFSFTLFFYSFRHSSDYPEGVPTDSPIRLPTIMLGCQFIFPHRGFTQYYCSNTILLHHHFKIPTRFFSFNSCNLPIPIYHLGGPRALQVRLPIQTMTNPVMAAL